MNYQALFSLKITNGMVTSADKIRILKLMNKAGVQQKCISALGTSVAD